MTRSFQNLEVMNDPATSAKKTKVLQAEIDAARKEIFDRLNKGGPELQHHRADRR